MNTNHHRRPWLTLLAMALGLSWLTPLVVAADAAPRPGKYLIQSYGATNRPPLTLGYLVLGNGTYESFLNGGKSAGAGTYSYDAGAKKVSWLSGPYVGQWGGDFTIEREGKTHKIRLKRTTIATNTVE